MPSAPCWKTAARHPARNKPEDLPSEATKAAVSELPETEVTRGGTPPTNSDEYQNKGLTKFAFHKCLILKSLDRGAIAATRGTWTGTITLPPPPMIFVSVASKGLRYCASPLFATHRRWLRSVASKGLRLHQNCAHFRACCEG